MGASISKFINAYKSASSRIIKKDFPEIKEGLYEGQFWSRSFCLLTLGDIREDIIWAYIKKQGIVTHSENRNENNYREGTGL